MHTQEDIRVNIHGSCVSRDIFEYDKEEIFKVSEYVARNSIISAVSPILNLNADFFEKGDWQKRMVQIDCSKTLFSRFKDNFADYIILDLIDERFSLNYVSGTYITWSGGAEKYLTNISCNLVHASKFSRKTLIEFVDRYCEQLLQIYCPQQIILYKAIFVNEYIDHTGSIKRFPSEKMSYYDSLNQYISFLYNEMESRLNCHTITLPRGTFAAENNKWGLAPMHYENNCYLSVLTELKKVIGG